MSERRVFKYGPLEIGTPSGVEARVGARVVAFSQQGGPRLYLWAEIDPDAPLHMLPYIVVGTGHAIPPGARHVATWVSDAYVWHLYVPASQEKVTP